MSHTKRNSHRSLLSASLIGMLLLVSGLLLTLGGKATAESAPLDPVVQEIMDQVTTADLMAIDRGLSGEDGVIVGGEPYTFTTRYTRQGPAIQKTWQYAYEQFEQAGVAASYHDYTAGGYSLKNTIGTITGTTEPAQQYLLTAHIDDTSQNAYNYAPGADDNGSGSSVLIEAARILSQYTADKTMKVIAFTGEEQGLWGSQAYASAARGRNDDIRGVLNADMIAWDSNNDMRGEIHSGTRSDSNALADVFFDTVSSYSIPLTLTRYTTNPETGSDHYYFWQNNYPAFLAIELDRGGDFNAYYHTTNDRVNCGGNNPCGFNQAYFTAYAKAMIGTLARLAGVHPRTVTTPTPSPVPPTETPEPPTETPVPPTATPVLPTSTPEEPTATATVEPTPCSITFTDVPSGSTFYPYVRCLACRGIVSGYDDGTFRPNNNMTRGQISKLVSNAIGFDDPIPPNQQTYTDVPPSDTFWLWIERLTLHHVVSGYSDGTFRPYNNSTRGQMVKIVGSQAPWPPPPVWEDQYFADVALGDPIYSWAQLLYLHNIVRGYPCGGPGEPCDEHNRPYLRAYANVTRGQASKMVAATFYEGCETPRTK